MSPFGDVLSHRWDVALDRSRVACTSRHPLGGGSRGQACAILTAVEGATTPLPQPQTFPLAAVRDPPGAAVDLSGRRLPRPPGQPDDTDDFRRSANRCATTDPPAGRGVWTARWPGAFVTDQNLPGTASAGENNQTATERTDGPDAATSAPPRRTRSRRAAGAPVTTPAPADEAAAPARAAAPAKDAQDAPDVAPAAKTSTPRKRSPRKAAAPVTEAPAGAESPAEPPKETGAGAEGAPARPRRSRRTATTSAPPAAAAPDEPDEATRRDATEPVAAESAGAVVQVGGAPRLAATALLFQAPDPTTRPRRRRAEAPAGPPRHPDEDLRFGAAVAKVPVEDLADEELTEDETPADDAVDAPVREDEHDEGAARRRRRRGGRGRRGRSGGEHGEDHDDRDEQTGTDEAETPAEDAPQAEAPKGRGSRRTTGAATSSTAGRKRGGRPAAAPTEDDAASGADVDAD